MDEQARGRLVELMAQLAGGDGAAVHALLEEFGPSIRAAVRRCLRRLLVPADQELVAELTVQACLELADCAASWDPAGGALPWNWAERRLRSMVSATVGQFADPFDADVCDRPAPPPAYLAADPDEDATLADLAAHLPAAGLLREAFDTVTTPLHQRVVLAFEVQKQSGDPTPAATVAQRFGLSPANVRQITKRTKDKLRALARSEHRYAGLAQLPLLA